MKRFLFCSMLSLLLSIPLLNAQSIKHMKFMGIPIDGKPSTFCNKLEGMGFYKDTGKVPNASCYVGKFYGEDANIQVNYTHDTYTVYSVNVYIIKKTALELYPILRDFLKGVEDKYKYERKAVNPQLYQYDYYIFDGFDPIGLIQTFIVDSNSVPTTQEAMLSINYVDVENYLNYENRKRNDI